VPFGSGAGERDYQDVGQGVDEVEGVEVPPTSKLSISIEYR